MGKRSPHRRKHNPAAAQHCPINPPKSLHPLHFSEVPLLLILRNPPKSRLSKEVLLIKISLAACTQTQSSRDEPSSARRVQGERGKCNDKNKERSHFLKKKTKKVQPPFPRAQLQQGERLNVDRRGICECLLSFLGGILNSRNMFPLETFPSIWSNFLLQELNQLMM